MPPQISDDVTSETSEEITFTKEKLNEQEERSLLVESEVDEDEEDDDIGEDEYVVEKITNHIIDEASGEFQYEVKWLGYDKRSERTWEPEENLETAPDILSEYLAKLGGKELLLSQWKEKKAQVEEKKSKKRARSSTGQETVVTKRGRKNDVEHGSGTPPASARRGEFKPPTGSWEDEVTGIDACEGSQGKVVVYLTWKGGDKSQHPLAQVYKRCPQKMLKFYESHLVFKKTEDTESN